MSTKIDKTLRALDAEPPTRPTDAELRRRGAMLERVVAAPRTNPRPAARPARAGARRRALLAAGVAVLVVPTAVVGVHALSRQPDPGSHSLGGADLASWVSTASPRSAAQLSTTAKQWCITATDTQAGADAAVSIAGGDERGDVASMVITRGGYTDICLANRAGGGGAWEIVSGPRMPIAPVAARELLLQSSGQQGSNGIGTAWGQAGTDISAVTLHLGTRDVNAVVTDGIWNTWWPTARIADGFARTATVTYADGSSATIPVRTR